MNKKHTFDYTSDSQRVFRVLLELLANPGSILSISEMAPLFAGNGLWLATAATLLDNEVTHYWNGDPGDGAEICYLTGSPGADIRDADFILLPEPADPFEALPLVKPGTYESPHTSATLIIGSDGKTAAECALEGPGVPPGGRRLALGQYERDWVQARDARNCEYPLGVDLIFLRAGGDMAALTRKVGVKWLT